jgi:hypothetical protein
MVRLTDEYKQKLINDGKLKNNIPIKPPIIDKPNVVVDNKEPEKLIDVIAPILNAMRISQENLSLANTEMTERIVSVLEKPVDKVIEQWEFDIVRDKNDLLVKVIARQIT